MARRAKGEGSEIHDKKHNRWIYQYYVKDVKGKLKRKAIYAQSQTALHQRMAWLEKKLRSEITLGDWMIMWLEHYVKPTIKSTTAENYTLILKYVSEPLKKKRLNQLSGLDFQKMFNENLEHGNKHGGPLSPTTIRSLRSLLISCIDCAIENELIYKNIIKATKPPKANPRQIICLTKEQAKRLIQVADAGKYSIAPEKADDGQRYMIKIYALAVRLCLATQLRKGELFALSWSDIDFSKKQIKITKNLQKSNKKERYEITTPKTQTSIRTISIDDDTLMHLKIFRKQQNTYANILGETFKNQNNLVFTTIFGQYINMDNFRNRQWKGMCHAAQLPQGFTFHGLRHTGATLLLEAGVGPKIVSQRLGHTNVAFTLRVYAHVLSSMEAEAPAAWASIISSEPKEKE
jgi:integrase